MKTARKLLLYLALIIGAFIMVMPFMWMITTTLKPLKLTYESPYLIPRYFVIENHIKYLVDLRKNHSALIDGKTELFYPNDRTLVIVRYNENEKVKCYINFGFQSDQVDGINIEAMNYKIVFRGGSDDKGYE